MKNQILVRRYTQGLIKSLQDDPEFSRVSGDLSHFAGLLYRERKLDDVLNSPFLSAARKKRVADEILARLPYAEKAKRFIRLLVENKRLELFAGIMDSLAEAWNDERGISTCEVASVAPLSPGQKKRLEGKLASLTKGPVVLKYRIDPELLGGLRIRRKNIVYDGSIKGYLTKLREIICEG